MMLTWGWSRRLWYGAAHAIGLGVLAGALEAVGLAATLHLPLGFGGFVALALAAMASMGALAFVLGLGVGLIVHGPLRRLDASRAISVQLGAVAALLCGLYLWQGSAALLADGRAAGAIAMAVMPLAFGGVVFFNARFWLRRAELGVHAPVGWLPVAGGAGVAISLATAGLFASRDTGGRGALDGDRNVLIVSVDGLRRDRIGAFGGVDTATPRLDALAAEGVVFLDAVSPAPTPRPAHATLLTGLHPLRHEVIDARGRLSGGYTTLAEVLDDEGYATAAFVSSRSLAVASGLDQGFRTYDDDIGAPLAGLGHLGLLGGALRSGVIPSPDLRHDAVTVASFRRWLDAHAHVPFLAWVQLAGPSAVTTPGGYDAAVAELDHQIGDLLAAVDQRGLRDQTLVIVAGTYGVELDDGVHHRGLRDPVVGVPLIVRAPGVHARVGRVAPQVRLTDVFPTALSWLEFPAEDQTEGLELVGYMTGARSRAMWTTLVGVGPQGQVLVGVRDSGVKYVLDVASGREHLYDTTEGETRDLASEQPKALEGARALVSSEVRALERLIR